MNQDRVVILLSTYNGEKYLQEQLDSLASQSYKNIEIIVRDDGSRDRTLEILQSNNLHIMRNKENLGAKKSFSELLQYALQKSDLEYFMFCDQDDIWENNKVEKSMNGLKDMKNRYGDIPMLVHTDLTVVDENMNIINSSFWNYQNINPLYNSFERSLMQNTITGCTILINRKLAQLSASIPKEAIMHDWWMGLCASYFGKIGLLKDSTIKYRQHSSNEIGAKGFTIQYVINRIFKPEDKQINNTILQAKLFLKIFNEQLDKETKIMLENFIYIKKKNYFQRRIFILKNGLLKQGLVRNIGLFVRI